MDKLQENNDIPATGSVNKEQLTAAGEDLKGYLEANDLQNDEFYYVSAAFIAIHGLLEFWNRKDEEIEKQENPQ